MKKNLLSLLSFFILLSLMMVSAINAEVSAKRITTRLSAPKFTSASRQHTHKEPLTHGYEFEQISRKLTFMAYDKRAAADKETFFVDNGSDTDLSAIEIEISYFNSAGKLIHKREVEIRQDFPANESRKADIPTWDIQKSFHYINSVPSRKGSSPYTVRFKILSVTPAQ